MELIVRKIAIGEELSFRDKVYTLDPDTDLFVPNIPEDLRKFKKGLREIIFLTGNKNKLTELKTSLSLNGDIKLVCPNEKINLAEIQDAEILNIVHDKCRRACEHLNEERACESDSNHDGDSGQVILVEDTCLNFGALNGMPGPYVKWFLEAIGPEGLFRMLMGFPNKSAEAVCIYALKSLDGLNQGDGHDSSPSSPNVKEETVLFFRGIALGRIVEPRRGNPNMGWGWDPIFEEERSRMTFAEMEAEVKSKFSHRANALRVLKTFLEM